MFVIVLRDERTIVFALPLLLLVLVLVLVPELWEAEALLLLLSTKLDRD